MSSRLSARAGMVSDEGIESLKGDCQESVSYQLEMDSDSQQHARWRYKDLSEDMLALLDIVFEALESGVSYTRDLCGFVDERLGGCITEDQRLYRVDRVDGGHWGMEIYYAKCLAERRLAQVREAELFRRAQQISIGTEYKNIRSSVSGKVYRFTSMVLSGLNNEEQRMIFNVKRRGVKGSAILTLPASSFFHNVEQSEALKAVVDLKKRDPDVGHNKDDKTMPLF